MSLINYLTKIHFADDILEAALRVETVALEATRLLIIADERAHKTGQVERIEDALPSRTDCIILDPVTAGPSEREAILAASAYRQSDCDLILGCGGAGAMDVAKATALLVSHNGPLASYAATEGGMSRIRGPLPTIVAVPTTAGAGSEVSPSAEILTDGGRKLCIVSPLLIPRVAICDPTLTLDASPSLTASTGMDAITHCVETFLAMAYNPPADGIAFDGFKRAVLNIERVVDRGTDLDARREMMAAALNGALAFQKGLGGVHAMSHALDGLAAGRLDHGTLNAVLLPHMLDFNEPAVGDRYGLLQEAMPVPRPARLTEAVSQLAERVGLPSSLSGLGIEHEALEKAAVLAEKDHASSTNPRIATADDYLEVMRAAF